MKKGKKSLYSILVIFFVSIILNRNIVYADVISLQPENNYTPSYYIAMIIVIALVVDISILILRKIYKDNQLEKENNEKIEKGVEK